MDFMTNNLIKLIFMFVNNFINYYYSFKLNKQNYMGYY